MAELVARVEASPARLGAVRLVCIDGPAGSGKTTLAGRLAGALGDVATVVHLEDLYAGWSMTGAVGRLEAGVLRPLAEGRAGAHHRYDWAAERFAPQPTPVPVRPVLLVEGCGSSPRRLDRWTSLRIWVEAPAELRVARGLARDGAELAPQWRRWQTTEAAEFAREDTRMRADLRLDSAAASPAGAFVSLQGTAPGTTAGT
ncbi:Uridine kinase [Blastococcus mobilis]|uniref:Uridine kinase n=1 Tax=Blastococcus mobilis TaxID=1938746 RepID=A0A238ZY89_9ACTN|nr:Uridine kinase [Blastococcus mobilis]